MIFLFHRHSPAFLGLTNFLKPCPALVFTQAIRLSIALAAGTLDDDDHALRPISQIILSNVLRNAGS